MSCPNQEQLVLGYMQAPVCLPHLDRDREVVGGQLEERPERLVKLCHDEHPCTYSIWKNYVEVYARDRLTKSQIIPIYNFAKYFQISFQYHYTNSPAHWTLQGVRAKDVKDLIPLVILMVILFLLLLFWENELDEEVMAATLEQLHVDYPQSDVPVRYCNHMIIQRLIKEANNTCKKEHVFVHERPRNINSVCNSLRKVSCQNHSTLLCFQSETKFKMTVCKLIEGTRYPACSYHISPTEGFIVVTCDDMGPVNIQRYDE
nr:probable inactive ribonuclease-like protein 12 [Globicephala melas]